MYFFFKDSATTAIYTYRLTLSLHAALPISAFHALLELGSVVRDPAPCTAERERRPDDRRQPGMVERRQRLLHRMRDRRARAFEPDLAHRLAEFEPILSLVDRKSTRLNSSH